MAKSNKILGTNFDAFIRVECGTFKHKSEIVHKTNTPFWNNLNLKMFVSPKNSITNLISPVTAADTISVSVWESAFQNEGLGSLFFPSFLPFFLSFFPFFHSSFPHPCSFSGDKLLTQKGNCCINIGSLLSEMPLQDAHPVLEKSLPLKVVEKRKKSFQNLKKSRPDKKIASCSGYITFTLAFELQSNLQSPAKHFGLPLEQSLANSKQSGFEHVTHACIKFLKIYGTLFSLSLGDTHLILGPETVGIIRVPGNKNNINSLKKAFDKGSLYPLSYIIYPISYIIYHISYILIRFLRLPTSLNHYIAAHHYITTSLHHYITS